MSPSPLELSVDQVKNALKAVIDPEVGINIVDLGLVYEVEVTDDALQVAMTMTSPACPMGGLIQEDVEECLKELAGPDRKVGLDIVWEPAWSPDRMSTLARLQLGIAF